MKSIPLMPQKVFVVGSNRDFVLLSGVEHFPGAVAQGNKAEFIMLEFSTTVGLNLDQTAKSPGSPIQ